MDEDRRKQLLLALIVGNVIFTLSVAGWAVWAVADPEYWFPDAFAEVGPVGDEGPRGERGARGPAGHPGPSGPGVEDAQATADDASSRVDEAEGRLDNLEGIDVYDLDSRVSEVESRVDEACNVLSSELDTFGC